MHALASRLFVALVMLAAELHAQNLLDTAFLVRPDLAPGSRAEVLLTGAPTDLKCIVRAEGGEAQSCTIVERHAVSLTLVLPVDAPVGKGEITLASGELSRVFPVRIHPVRFVPQFRAAAPSVVAQQISAGAHVRSNGLLAPALPGDRVMLWGTGLGVRPDPLRMQVRVGEDGAESPVLFTERLADGRDLIEFVLPESGTPLDCYVPLTVLVDRVPFFGGSIAIADERGACRHRLGLGSTELSALDRGARVPVAYLTLSRLVGMHTGAPALVNYSESALFWSEMASAADVENVTGPLPGAPRDGCRITRDDTRPLFAISGNPTPVLASPLKLTGPENETSPLQLTNQGGFFHWTSGGVKAGLDGVPAAISEGKWALELPADYQGSWTFSAPAPLDLVAQSPFQWNAKAYRVADRAHLTVMSATGSNTMITCESSAAAGTLIVPPQLLANAGIDPSNAEATLTLAPSLANSAFRLPRPDGTTGFGLVRFWHSYRIGPSGLAGGLF